MDARVGPDVLETRQISCPCWDPKSGSSSPQPKYLILWKTLQVHYDTTHTDSKNGTYRKIFLDRYHNTNFHPMHWSFLRVLFLFIFFLPTWSIYLIMKYFHPCTLHVATAGDSVFKYKEVYLKACSC